MSDEQRVADSYYSRRVDGKLEQLTVSYYCPRADTRYVPDLEFNEARAAFVKWRLKRLIQNEERWGKDWLRRNGYVLERQRDAEGKLIKIYYRPSES